MSVLYMYFASGAIQRPAVADGPQPPGMATPFESNPVYGDLDVSSQGPPRVASFDKPIPAELWQALRDKGLLDPRAPVPKD